MFVVLRKREDFIIGLCLSNEQFGYSATYVVDHDCVFLTREAAEEWINDTIQWIEKNGQIPCEYTVKELV